MSLTSFCPLLKNLEQFLCTDICFPWAENGSSHIDYLYFYKNMLSVQLSSLVMSNSLQHHGLQCAGPPCPSPTPAAYSNSTSIELVMPSSHLILCGPLLLLPSIFPSIRVFSNDSVLRIWGRQWQPTPVLLPGKFHGQRSLVSRLQSMGSLRVGHDWATSL